MDDELLAAMDAFSFFAPAHNPPYIAAMKAFRDALPGVPLVAVFETIPYAQLDEAATTYAVPYEWRTEFGIRRYGFHGASHRAASENVRRQFNKPGLRHISCHLGGKLQHCGLPRWGGHRHQLRHIAAVRPAAEQSRGRH